MQGPFNIIFNIESFLLLYIIMQFKVMLIPSNTTNEPHHEKTCFCTYENKGADQLHNNWTADQHPLFSLHRYTLLQNPKFQAFTNLLWLCSRVCVGHGRKSGDRFSPDTDHIMKWYFLTDSLSVLFQYNVQFYIMRLHTI